MPPQVTDGSRVIAVANPFYNGDVLWEVPAARELARRHSELEGREVKVDFWVSPYGAACADLLACQSFTRRVIVDKGHDLLTMGYWMTEPERPEHGYLRTCQLGFRPGGFDVPIPEYYCRLVALPQLPNQFDLPREVVGRARLPFDRWGGEPFVVMASKAPPDSFASTFREAARQIMARGIMVVEVGCPADYRDTQAIASDLGASDRTGHGFCEMAAIISQCRWFVGQLSAPLVVASGFPCVKIGVHDGVHWNLSHSIRTPLHHYVAGYDPGLILEHIR
jgi:hypothetical protein